MPKIISEESELFKTAPEGTVFYSLKPSNKLSATAIYFNRRVETQQCILIEGNFSGPVAIPITKVTIKGFIEKEES